MQLLSLVLLGERPKQSEVLFPIAFFSNLSVVGIHVVLSYANKSSDEFCFWVTWNKTVVKQQQPI